MDEFESFALIAISDQCSDLHKLSLALAVLSFGFS